MTPPKLSIIIPVFQNLLGLKKSIESIKNQIFKDYEVWIIDGGSDLDTQNYLSTLEKPFYYQSRVDKGIYDAMNKGIQLAKGDWLYFLGSDDVLFDENSLNTVFCNTNVNAASIIAGKVVYSGSQPAFIYNAKKKVKEVFWSNFMWIRNGLHHQSTFYKKEIFETVKYNLKYPVLADYWLNLYLFKHGFSCKVVHAIIAKCSADGISKSGDWTIYKEEINLKIALSNKVLKPLFYCIAKIKYSFRKRLHDS